MATFKAEIYKHQKRSDGTWNMKIRVTHNRQKKYLSTPIYVKLDDIIRTSYKLKKYYAAADGLNAAVNRGLKKIGEEVGVNDLEFYSARHSWASPGMICESINM